MIKEERGNDTIIEKILELSKEKKIIWEYLDEYENLYQHLRVTPKRKRLDDKVSWTDITESVATALYTYTFFDANASFYANIGENYIVLISEMIKNEENILIPDTLKLMLVPRTFKDIRIIEENDLMLRLHNYVRTQFPDVEDIIEDIDRKSVV